MHCIINRDEKKTVPRSHRFSLLNLDEASQVQVQVQPNKFELNWSPYQAGPKSQNKIRVIYHIKTNKYVRCIIFCSRILWILLS